MSQPNNLPFSYANAARKGIRSVHPTQQPVNDFPEMPTRSHGPPALAPPAQPSDENATKYPQSTEKSPRSAQQVEKSPQSVNQPEKSAWTVEKPSKSPQLPEQPAKSPWSSDQPAKSAHPVVKVPSPLPVLVHEAASASTNSTAAPPSVDVSAPSPTPMVRSWAALFSKKSTVEQPQNQVADVKLPEQPLRKIGASPALGLRSDVQSHVLSDAADISQQQALAVHLEELGVDDNEVGEYFSEGPAMDRTQQDSVDADEPDERADQVQPPRNDVWRESSAVAMPTRDLTVHSRSPHSMHYVLQQRPATTPFSPYQQNAPNQHIMYMQPHSLPSLMECEVPPPLPPQPYQMIPMQQVQQQQGTVAYEINGTMYFQQPGMQQAIHLMPPDQPPVVSHSPIYQPENPLPVPQQHQQYQQQQQQCADYSAPPPHLNFPPPPYNHPNHQRFPQRGPVQGIPTVNQFVHQQQVQNVGSRMDNWNTAVQNMELENKIRNKIGLLIHGRYFVENKVNTGSYGSIFTAWDTLQHRVVAVKFENLTVEDSHLGYEKDVYIACGMMRPENGTNQARFAQPIVGFPRVYWIGEEFRYKIMVMDLLGPSLENLFHYCSANFSKQTVIKLGLQMIDRIENLHNRGFIHRDLKPENFLMGLGEYENTCYLIDFGLARRCRLDTAPRKPKHLVGTAKYASLNSHNGLNQSKRDDLESLAYILLEFILGQLPWKQDRSKNKNRSKQQNYNWIQNIKEQFDWSQCTPMEEWIKYTRSLSYDDTPDYERLRDILRTYEKSWYDYKKMGKIEASQAIGHDKNNKIEPGSNNRDNKKWNNKNKPSTSTKHANPGRTDVARPAVPSPGGATQRSVPSFEPPNTSVSTPFEWYQRRDMNMGEKFTYDCLYRWTLPRGTAPILPANHQTSNRFGLGFGEGGFV